MSESQRKHFEIENVIPPEIKNDALYRLIEQLSAGENLRHVLEIGSSSGAGSTEAFVRGLARNPGHPNLYCLELSPERFRKLSDTYKDKPFVKTYNASSVGPQNLPTPAQLSAFYAKYKIKLRVYNEATVQKWLADDREYLNSYADVEKEGIELVKRENGIDKFDMVLIDGSEFLGSAELEHVYGARIILLDDTRTFKTFECCERLRNDPRYELIAEDKNLRNGFAAFRLRDIRKDELPVHFFTIVLNGKPFIEYHIDMMRRLPFKWVWHIVEGVADLVNDTAWSKASGGRVPDSLHRNGLSSDGTSEYLDSLAAKYPDNVKLYRTEGGRFWQGKREMCNAALSGVGENCLLWQLDADELWTAGQIATMRQMFLEHPEKTSAFFWCAFFFGPDRIVSTRNCYSQNPSMEWLRVWRFRPGMQWAAHEPPVLAARGADGRNVDQGRVCPFLHAETEKAGLVFQHFAYATREQVEFKEIYYGYQNAVAGWEHLQSVERLPVALNGIVPWVRDGTKIDRAAPLGVNPLAAPSADGQWRFRREDRDPDIEVIEGKSNIVIDGVFFQYYHTGIARVWNSLLREWSGTEFARRLVVIDRGNSMRDDRIPGITYLTAPKHSYSNLETESRLLDGMCVNLHATACTSTYYTHTTHTPYVMLVHDMIPEQERAYNLGDPMWVEKRNAIHYASKFVCVSENTAKDLQRLFPEVDRQRVQVARNGLSGAFRRPSQQAIDAFRHRYALRNPYYMMSGAWTGYKNGICLFRAFNKFPARAGFGIVCSGPQPFGKRERDLAEGSPVLQAFFDEEELICAYAGAVALVVPSFYEGFGLPVLEAMGCGCPVISSNRTSLPEVAGDAAILFDPSKADELTEALAEVLKPSVRTRMIDAGLARADQFSWKRMADKFRAVLEEAADGRASSAPLPEEDRFASVTPDDALRLMGEGKIWDAVAAFDSLARRGSLQPSALNDRAVAHYRLADVTRQRSEAENAVRLLVELTTACPSLANAWKNLFVVAGSLGDKAMQKTACDGLAAAAPDDRDLAAMRGRLGA